MLPQPGRDSRPCCRGGPGEVWPLVGCEPDHLAQTRLQRTLPFLPDVSLGVVLRLRFAPTLHSSA